MDYEAVWISLHDTAPVKILRSHLPVILLPVSQIPSIKASLADKYPTAVDGQAGWQLQKGTRRLGLCRPSDRSNSFNTHTCGDELVAQAAVTLP